MNADDAASWLSALDQLDAVSKILRGLFKKQQPPPLDTTPPSNPSSLSVSIVSGVPHVTWTASTDNYVVVGYQIWRKTGSGGTYAQIDTSPTNSYDDHTAASGSTYFYKVAAFDAAQNVSGFSNEFSQAVSSADVTAPNVPAQPAAATVNNAVNPPSYTTNWPAVTDIDPGDGSPVSGVKQYRVYHDYPAANTLQGIVAQTGGVGSPSPLVIGINSGGSPVTGSDTGTVLSATSTTGDNNAQQWGTSSEFFLSGAPVQGAGSAVMQLTAHTPVTGYDWSKLGLELTQNLSAGSSFTNLLYFGANQGLKGEQRLADGAQTTGGPQVAFATLPLWLKLTWDNNWNVTRSYSHDSTNGTDGTWTTYDTIAMGWPPGSVAYIGKFADPSTVGRAGGTVSATYAHFGVTGASPIAWSGSGVAGQAINVTVKAEDFAGNLSAASTARAVTFGSATAVGFPISGVWAAQPSTDTKYLQGLAKYNLVEGVYNLLQQVSIPAVNNMGSIKSYAAANGNPWCKILQYNIMNEWWPSTGLAGFFNNALLALLNATPLWWLTKTWPTLTQVTSQDNDTRKATNISDTTQVVNLATVGSVTGPGNVNYAQANVWLWLQQYVFGKAKALNASDPSVPANPNVDGMAIDNQEIGCPYVSGNHLNTATLYSCAAGQLVPAVQGPVQHGYQQAIDMVRSVYPTVPDGSEFLILGNVDGYGLGAGAPYKTSIQGKYDLPMAEDPFGRFEQNQGATYSTMLASLTGMEVCLRPGLNHFMVGLMESMAFNGNVGPINFPTNQSSWTAAHWQAARYQFANFTLLRWIAMFSNPVSATNLWFFDELLGGPTQVFQYLGQPTGPRDLTVWKQGLRKGDFANGSVIINPKGNGAQTFTMPYSGHRLATAGFGDASYNNGASFTTATSMTLQDRDAIFIRNS